MTKVIGSSDDRDVSLLAQDQYFRQVHWTPRTSEEEDRVLLERVQRGKGPDGRLSLDAVAARDRLVEGHQPLVISLASRLVRLCRVLERLDLIQEGSLGLLRAIERYDAAVVWSVPKWFALHIHDAMSLAILEQDSVVRLTSCVRKELNVLRRAEASLGEMWQRVPTVAELAASLGMAEHKVRELRCYRQWKEVESLQGLLADDEEEDRRDFVSLFEQSVKESSWRSERVREAVATALTKRQQEVIRSRYGMHEDDGREQSQVEAAASLGVHEQTIHYQEQGAYRRLYPVLAVSCQMVEAEAGPFFCHHCGREFARRFGKFTDNLYCTDNCRGAARRARTRQAQEVA